MGFAGNSGDSILNSGNLTSDGANQMIIRYVHGTSPGDDPPVNYSGSAVSLSNARFYYRDRLGSVVMQADYAGTSVTTYAYDEFGVPQPGPTPRFGFTGQAWVPEAGLYYYKARMYSPTLGRFMQTDPIGYADGLNMYRYVGNDPVNAVDPTGLSACRTSAGEVGTLSDNGVCQEAIIVTGKKLSSSAGGGGAGSTGLIIVTGTRSIGYSLPPGAVVGPLADQRVFAIGGDPTDGTGSPQNDKPGVLEKAGQCALDQAGLGEAGSAAAAASGANVLPTRGKPSGAVPNTSPASRAAGAVFGEARVPGGARLPTLTGWPRSLGGAGMNVRRTASVARIVGRGVPVVGWVLLAYDAGSIVGCTLSSDE